MSQRPSWFPEKEFPFQSNFIEIEGHKVHYVDEGSGPTILLLHGNPTWSFLYREIIEGLKNHFRCIALDYPGFGLSIPAPGYDFTPARHADTVTKFVSALNLTDFFIMVQDWGGPIGFHVAAQHASKISGVVIGNTWAWPAVGDKHFERFSRIMGGPLGGFAIRNFNAFVNVMIPMGVRRHKLPRSVMAAYRNPFPTKASRIPTHIFPREILGSTEFLHQVEKGLCCLSDKPALILWGNRDIAFRDIERKRFEALFPNHRTQILQGAGHYIQEDAPKEIVVAILQWKDEFIKASSRDAATSREEERQE